MNYCFIPALKVKIRLLGSNISPDLRSAANEIFQTFDYCPNPFINLLFNISLFLVIVVNSNHQNYLPPISCVY